MPLLFYSKIASIIKSEAVRIQAKSTLYTLKLIPAMASRIVREVSKYTIVLHITEEKDAQGLYIIVIPNNCIR